MRVLVAMSGGVDSSVAAALLRDDSHEVVGVTLKLWGGESDSGCCSVSDVEDARRVADRLGVEHLVFNFGDDFTRHVVEPYVADHAAGRTPNPCIECNRHLKFDRLLSRAVALGFDALATGHHARIVPAGPAGGPRLARGADAAKDQSYVLHVLDAGQLGRVLLPIGGLTKAEVRERAAALDLRTAAKPDSQDVCFITRTGGGRRAFLGDRIPLRPGRLVDTAGTPVGTVEAVELVTVGQRRGLGTAGDGTPRFALSVDVAAATVVVGPAGLLDTPAELVERWGWVDAGAEGDVCAGKVSRLTAQVSAHGEPIPVASVEVLDPAVPNPTADPTADPTVDPTAHPPGRDLTARDLTTGDVTARDRPARDLTTGDFTTRDRTARDLTTCDVTARDRPARDRAGTGADPGPAPAGAGARVRVTWAEPQRRVAPGQSLVLYDGDVVLAGGTVTTP